MNYKSIFSILVIYLIFFPINGNRQANSSENNKHVVSNANTLNDLKNEGKKYSVCKFTIFENPEINPPHEAAEIKQGCGKITVKFIVDSKAVNGIGIRLYFNNGSEKTPIGYTDEKGKVDFSIVPTNYVFNGIEVTYCAGIDFAQKVYVPIRAKTLKPVSYTDLSGKNYVMKVNCKEPISLNISFVSPIEVLSPKNVEKHTLKELRENNSVLMWKPYPDAYEYIIQIYVVKSKNDSIIYYPIKKLNQPSNKILLKKIFTDDILRKGNAFAVKIIAYDKKNIFLSESKNYIRFHQLETNSLGKQ